MAKLLIRPLLALPSQALETSGPGLLAFSQPDGPQVRGNRLVTCGGSPLLQRIFLMLMQADLQHLAAWNVSFLFPFWHQRLSPL